MYAARRSVHRAHVDNKSVEPNKFKKNPEDRHLFAARVATRRTYVDNESFESDQVTTAAGKESSVRCSYINLPYSYKQRIPVVEQSTAMAGQGQVDVHEWLDKGHLLAARMCRSLQTIIL